VSDPSPRWDLKNVRPDWLTRGGVANTGRSGTVDTRKIIAVENDLAGGHRGSGWVYRLQYTNAYAQLITKDELLVAIKGLANTTNANAPYIEEVYSANSLGGGLLYSGQKCFAVVVYDMPLYSPGIAQPGCGTAWTMKLANTGGAHANGSANGLTATSNGTIGIANNAVYFAFSPVQKGTATYKVIAQTLVNTTHSLRTTNKSKVMANLVISAGVSNAHGTFSVYGAPYIKAVTWANSSGGGTIKRNLNNFIVVTFNQALKASVAGWTLNVANTASGSAKTATSQSALANSTSLQFLFIPTVAGTYKVQAQSLANTAGPNLILAADTGAVPVFRVISGGAAGVSNTAGSKVVA
jgi:hypothetical protein